MNGETFTRFMVEYNIAVIGALFLLFALLEVLAPQARPQQSLGFRWFGNFALAAVTMLTLKLATPLIGLATAMAARQLDVGLLNHVEAGFLANLLLGSVLLDLKQYWYHRLVHYFHVLWRLHQVHHSDGEIDLTTGFRFHPLEALLGALIDVVVIAVFGIAAEALLLRYVLSYFINFFSHANFRLPQRLDYYLKWLFVTPSMHRVHHAEDARAANSNFGALLSVWDRLFRTYRESEAAGPDRYGLSYRRDFRRMTTMMMLLMPFTTAPPDNCADHDRHT